MSRMTIEGPAAASNVRASGIGRTASMPALCVNVMTADDTRGSHNLMVVSYEPETSRLLPLRKEPHRT